MTRFEHLRESEPSNFSISKDQAAAISSLGRNLASKTQWWGTSASDAGDDDRTIITCFPTVAGQWRICVNNAIGAFGVGDLTFIVEPKIPLSHVLYIFSKAVTLPRMDDSPITLGHAFDLLELIARWFLRETRAVIARDLIRDYESTESPLSFVRGQLNALSTADRFYSGSLELDCIHDEFTIDNPLNRVLLGALRALQGSEALTDMTRRECYAVASYFDDVSEFVTADLFVEIDRRTTYYGDALGLARLILSSSSVTLQEGSARAWTFLIRTPEAIESGIRTILQEGLSPDVSIKKYATALDPKSMTIQPDLRFDGGNATGDVKYKMFGGDWPRGDLYQNVAFAVGTGVTRGCIVSFTSGRTPLQWVRFRSVEVSNLVWDARESTNPQDSANALVQDCRRWLNLDFA